jgi:hypothetical protein
MRELGFEVEELTLDAKVGYSSRMYRLPDERISWWKFMTAFPESDPEAPESKQCNTSASYFRSKTTVS